MSASSSNPPPTRISKFKHISGSPKKDWKWINVKVGDFKIESNHKYFAFPWNTPNANTLAVCSFEPTEFSLRKFPDSPALLVNSCTILGFDLHPFVANVLATGGRDGVVKLWQFPEEGIRRNIEEPVLSLTSHTKRVGLVQFHSTVNHLLATAAADSTVKLWDVEAGKEMVSVSGHDDIALSLSFNFDGSKFATSCKDKKLRLFDSRKSSGAVMETEAHESTKGFNVVWLGEQEKVISVGFNKASNREIALWDSRNLSKAVTRVLMNVSSSALVPFYDPGCDILYLSDKGEGIHCYEITPEAPFVQVVTECKFSTPLLATEFLPKRLCDVTKCEIAQFIKLNKDQVEFVSLQIPRKTGYFQEDLFPPVPSGEPTTTASEFFAGSQAQPKLISLKPANMVSIFDVPEEQGGKKKAVVAEESSSDSGTSSKSTDGSDSKKDANEPGFKAALEGQVAELTSMFFRKFRSVFLSLKDGVLYVFESADAPTSLYTLELKSNFKITCPDKDLWEQIQDVSFSITNGSDVTHHYRATTKTEALRWVTALQDAVTKSASSSSSSRNSSRRPSIDPSKSVLVPNSSSNNSLSTMSHSPSNSNLTVSSATMSHSPSNSSLSASSSSSTTTAATAATAAATTATTATATTTDMTGKLIKVGTLFAQTGLFRSWKPRHVKLVRMGAIGSKLMLYESETAKSPSATIDTSRVTWVSLKDLDPAQQAAAFQSKTGVVTRLLEIVSLGRVHILQTVSEQDGNEWVKAIQQCSNFFFESEPGALSSSDGSFVKCGPCDPKCVHVTRGDVLTLKEPGLMFDGWPQRWSRVEGGVLKLYPWIPEKETLEPMMEDIHISKVLYVRLSVGSSIIGSSASQQRQQQHSQHLQQEQEMIAADPGVLTEFQIITGTKVVFMRASTALKAQVWVSELEYIRNALQEQALKPQRTSTAINLLDVATLKDPDALANKKTGDGESGGSGGGDGDGDDGEDDSDIRNGSFSITPAPVKSTTVLEGLIERPQGMLGFYGTAWMSLIGKDLFIYKARGAMQPEKRITLSSILTVAESEKDADLGFVIRTKDEIMELRAKSPEERDRWCAVLLCMLHVDESLTVAKTLSVPEEEKEDSEDVANAPVFERQDVQTGKKLLLIRCVAKRRGYSQLVELSSSSLNSACSFVLDTGKKIYQWNGKNASRLTKAKGWDIAMRIHKHERDGLATIITMEEGTKDEKKEFFEALGGKPESVPSAFDESLIKATPIKIYKILDNKDFTKRVAVIFEGRKPSKDILKTNFVYVVESEAELFVWIGKTSTTSARKLALRIAKTLLIQPERPSWKTLFKLFEGQESVLFKEKFDGFPGLFQGTGMMAEAKGNVAQTGVQKDINVIELYTAPKRKSKDDELLAIDESAEGRYKIWRVNDFEIEPFPRGLYGQLFGGDSYVIQYTYFYKNSDHHVIYYWQGKDSSVTEKGASALWTIELDDKELGGEATQLRVVMNKEPRHFLSMFKGKMLVRMGSFATFGSAGSVLMFDVRGSDAVTARGVETVNSTCHLHSWHSSVISGRAGTFTWHGKYSNDFEHRIAARLATQFKLEGQEVESIEEGDEPDAFWEMLGGKKPYFDGYGQERVTPLLYSFTNATGVVTGEQVFDFCQEDLEEDQVYLLDATHEIYLWFGLRSKPVVRRIAMETALRYIAEPTTKHPKGKDTPAWVVSSGKEPLQFLSHFHGWSKPALERDSESDGASNSRGRKSSSDVKKKDHMRKVQDVLTEYTQEIYTYEELLQELLPPGVDSTKLESYLSEQEFRKLFGMSKKEFDTLPPWKKDNLKKAVNLYQS